MTKLPDNHTGTEWAELAVEIFDEYETPEKRDERLAWLMDVADEKCTAFYYRNRDGETLTDREKYEWQYFWEVREHLDGVLHNPPGS